MPETQLATLAQLAIPAFADALAARGVGPIRGLPLEILQVNVGKQCNQVCRHCHVDAGPDRPEVMPPEVVADVLALLDRAPSIHTVDITGGAP